MRLGLNPHVGDVRISGEKIMRIVVLSVSHAKDLDNKIAAIKAARALTGMGLKEAKEIIECVTPSNSEVLKIPHNVMEPEFTENISALRRAGMTVAVTDPNSKIRMGIGDEIRKIVTYCTMSSQFDIAKALLDVMETYCPEPSEEFQKEKTDVEIDDA